MPYVAVNMYKLVENQGIMKLLKTYMYMIQALLKVIRAPHGINMALDAKEHTGENKYKYTGKMRIQNKLHLKTYLIDID